MSPEPRCIVIVLPENIMSYGKNDVSDHMTLHSYVECNVRLFNRLVVEVSGML